MIQYYCDRCGEKHEARLDYGEHGMGYYICPCSNCIKTLETEIETLEEGGVEQ